MDEFLVDVPGSEFTMLHFNVLLNWKWARSLQQFKLHEYDDYDFKSEQIRANKKKYKKYKK